MIQNRDLSSWEGGLEDDLTKSESPSASCSPSWIGVFSLGEKNQNKKQTYQILITRQGHTEFVKYEESVNDENWAITQISKMCTKKMEWKGEE